MSPARRRSNAPWLREQIANLHHAMCVRPLKPDEVTAALASIGRGEDFRAMPVRDGPHPMPAR